ncbi:MAG: hypothetical protein KAW45_02750 [Thermoplasmatales archaeon]|nr:hypothetical protein [Thermoplasmatales archaeon]
MTKILLTTVMRPFYVDSEDCTFQTQPELFHGQVTLAQGLFSMRTYSGGFGLEYIALNIKPKTVVLNYPSEKEFIKELKKNYDYIGISYVICTHKKMESMCELVRKYASNSKLILGGYGTTVPGADELADYVCREEGVTFMRRLLNEDINAVREHPIIPEYKKIMNVTINQGSIILAGLGCPNGCDFCITSHFYNRKHIPLLKTGEDIWNAILKIDAKLNTRLVGIIEEDFLLYKKRVLELAEYTRKEIKKPVRMAGFSSIKSINMYDPVFLAEMGMETLWIGIEAKSSQEIRERKEDIKKELDGKNIDISSYHKMENIDMKKTVKSLHDVGINTLISMIIGLEHHTKELVKKDLKYHLSLDPTLSQFLIYTPAPGTPLYECLDKEGRILKDIPLHKIDGFALAFKHKHMDANTVKKLQMYCFKKDYEDLGPSVFRFIQKNLTGYLRFQDSDILIQKARADVYAANCKMCYPLYDIGVKYAPNDKVAGEIADLRDKVYDIFGEPNIKQRFLTGIARIIAKNYQKKVENKKDVSQPKLQRVVYN